MEGLGLKGDAGGISEILSMKAYKEWFILFLLFFYCWIYTALESSTSDW